LPELGQPQTFGAKHASRRAFAVLPAKGEKANFYSLKFSRFLPISGINAANQTRELRPVYASNGKTISFKSR
jgi:hypothetical protein